jgi:hypothetical protein
MVRFRFFSPNHTATYIVNLLSNSPETFGERFSLTLQERVARFRPFQLLLHRRQRPNKKKMMKMTVSREAVDKFEV